MTDNTMTLTELTLSGYKSIDPVGQTIPFGDVTVLLGANGSGKSNLVSFFRLLSYLTSAGLQNYVSQEGGGSAVLHRGRTRADKVLFTVKLVQQVVDGGDRTTTYDVQLSSGRPDRLVVTGEQISYKRSDHPDPQEYSIDSGGAESGLEKDAHSTSQVLHGALSRIRAFQFHDTSDTARIKQAWRIDDGRYLRSDAGNLAAYLRRLKLGGETLPYYERILRHIRRVLPQFQDFDLDAIVDNDSRVRLDWHDQTSDERYWPHQLSDGSLRYMALATLLLQPPDSLPSVVVIDEPELGLHPSAIAELASMVRSAAQHCQVVIATQSPRLVDEFDAQNLVIVERDEARNCSVFRRLDADKQTSCRCGLRTTAFPNCGRRTCLGDCHERCVSLCARGRTHRTQLRKKRARALPGIFARVGAPPTGLDESCTPRSPSISWGPVLVRANPERFASLDAAEGERSGEIFDDFRPVRAAQGLPWADGRAAGTVCSRRGDRGRDGERYRRRSPDPIRPASRIRGTRTRGCEPTGRRVFRA